jgi:hypothetical protein
MVKLPAPPTARELAATDPERIELARGTWLWRIFREGGRYPVTWREFRYFGPLHVRFDHHLPPPRTQARGIYYAARDWRTSLAEVFQRERRIDRHLELPCLVGFQLALAVRLLDLTGRWTTRMGASMAIHAGPHGRARAWSRALYEAFPAAQGLLCCSSMDANRRTVVLYERSRAAPASRPSFHRPLSHPEIRPMLEAAAAEFGYLVA